MPSRSDSQEKIEPAIPGTSGGGADDSVTEYIGHKLSMDIFSHGCKVVLEHFNLDEQVEFYGRLSEKNSILSKLNHSINNILKFPKDAYKRIEILVSIKNRLLDYIGYHGDEVKIWWDIWAEELRKAKNFFTNFKDLDDDIWDMQFNLTNYNDEIFEELLGEINNTMMTYIPKDKSLAPSVAEKINKRLLLENVRSLVHYINFSHKNVFDYNVQYAISLLKHIKKQLNDTNFPILESLIEPVPKEFEIGWTDLDSALCDHNESEMEKLLKFKTSRSKAEKIKYGHIREKRVIYELSEDLAAIVGFKKATKTNVIKNLWIYIREKELLVCKCEFSFQLICFLINLNNYRILKTNYGSIVTMICRKLLERQHLKVMNYINISMSIFFYVNLMMKVTMKNLLILMMMISFEHLKYLLQCLWF